MFADSSIVYETKEISHVSYDFHRLFQEILDQARAPIKLVDIGCGNCDKTRLFIDAILKRQEKLDFIPVDIAEGLF